MSEEKMMGMSAGELYNSLQSHIDDLERAVSVPDNQRRRKMTDKQLDEFLSYKLRADEVLLPRNSNNNQASIVFDKSMTDEEVMEVLSYLNGEDQ